MFCIQSRAASKGLSHMVCFSWHGRVNEYVVIGVIFTGFLKCDFLNPNIFSEALLFLHIFLSKCIECNLSAEFLFTY